MTLTRTFLPSNMITNARQRMLHVYRRIKTKHKGISLCIGLLLSPYGLVIDPGAGRFR